MDYNPPGSSVYGDSPTKNTGVGHHAPLQGIFPTQGSNQGLPHYSWILYQLSYQRSPRILVWIACPYCRGSSWPRDWTRVRPILYQLSYPGSPFLSMSYYKKKKKKVSKDWREDILSFQDTAMSSKPRRPKHAQGNVCSWPLAYTANGDFLVFPPLEFPVSTAQRWQWALVKGSQRPCTTSTVSVCDLNFCYSHHLSEPRSSSLVPRLPAAAQSCLYTCDSFLSAPVSWVHFFCSQQRP